MLKPQENINVHIEKPINVMSLPILNTQESHCFWLENEGITQYLKTEE